MPGYGLEPGIVLIRIKEVACPVKVAHQMQAFDLNIVCIIAPVENILEKPLNLSLLTAFY